MEVYLSAEAQDSFPPSTKHPQTNNEVIWTYRTARVTNNKEDNSLNRNQPGQKYNRPAKKHLCAEQCFAA